MDASCQERPRHVPHRSGAHDHQQVAVAEQQFELIDDRLERVHVHRLHAAFAEAINEVGSAEGHEGLSAERQRNEPEPPYVQRSYNGDVIARTIRERLNRDPFEPFIIRSNSGQAVRVASPELAVLMKSGIFVAAPNSDRWAQLPYLHIAGLKSDTKGNGHGSSRRKPK